MLLHVLKPQVLLFSLKWIIEKKKKKTPKKQHCFEFTISFKFQIHDSMSSQMWEQVCHVWIAAHCMMEQ